MKIIPNKDASSGSGKTQTPMAGQMDGYAGGTLSNTKNFYTLPANSLFKAVILDIQPGKVSIRLDEGSTFTARSMVLPDARIGEESYFRVKSNNYEGLIELEMIKKPPEVRQDKLVREALTNAGMYASDENIALGKMLVERNLPIDVSTLQKIAFFRYSQPDNAPFLTEKAIFLLQEGFPANEASLKALNNSMNPNLHLAKQLTKLEESILKLPPSETKQIFYHTLNKLSARTTKDANSTKINLQPDSDEFKIRQKINFAAISNVSQHKSLKQFYSQLRDTLVQLQEQLSATGVSEENPQVFREVQRSVNAVRENLSFMNQVSQQIQYYQIPLQTSRGELFIYHDKKSSASLSKDANVLIALDTLALGRIEILANKKENRLTFQFSGDTDKVIGLIKAESHGLTKALHEKGFQITGLTYQKRKTERTTVLTPSPVQEVKQEETRRYAFDMRV
ncbi:MAG: flagellar hook-length control protein FliK [Defluviitaleaceae bacterium]|nr:flagellar hook-length control protein FliK [Defluviitaleaceae bacterium]